MTLTALMWLLFGVPAIIVPGWFVRRFISITRVLNGVTDRAAANFSDRFPWSRRIMKFLYGRSAEEATLDPDRDWQARVMRWLFRLMGIIATLSSVLILATELR